MIMSHRKVQSQGNVPFSWEEKPGVPKLTIVPLPTPLHQVRFYGAKSPVFIKIPPPPCASAVQPPRRSCSPIQGLTWQDNDPFMAALKSCSRNVLSSRDVTKNGIWDMGKSYGKSTSLSALTCKHSCDVEDGNYVKLSNLPPLPRAKNRAKSLG